MFCPNTNQNLHPTNTNQNFNPNTNTSCNCSCHDKCNCNSNTNQNFDPNFNPNNYNPNFNPNNNQNFNPNNNQNFNPNNNQNFNPNNYNPNFNPNNNNNFNPNSNTKTDPNTNNNYNNNIISDIDSKSKTNINSNTNPFTIYNDFKAIISLGVNDYDQLGWRISAHRYFDKDKRDKASTYVNCHKGEYSCQKWRFLKEGSHWRIIQCDNHYGEEGAYLTAHRWYDKDKRGDDSTYVCVHKDKKAGQIFDIQQESNGLYRITLADDHYGQKGWTLTSHRWFNADKREDMSTYVILHQSNQKQGQLWNVSKF